MLQSTIAIKLIILSVLSLGPAEQVVERERLPGRAALHGGGHGGAGHRERGRHLLRADRLDRVGAARVSAGARLQAETPEASTGTSHPVCEGGGDQSA